MNNNPSPKVSVLMSVYNEEPFLSDAIKSILNQTFKDLEFIIIDDGSTDRSCDIIEKFKANDPRVIFLKQANQGLVASLNKGLGIAKAPLIARMDADDIALEKRLEKQVNYMNLNPEVLALGTAIRIIDKNNSLIKDVIFPSLKEDLMELMQLDNQIAHPSVLYRKKSVINVGGYREILQYAEDFDLWLRLSEVGPIDNLNEVLLHYRDHPKNISKVENHSQRIAALCARYSSLRRKENKKDPLDEIEPPLNLEKIQAISLIPKEEMRNFTKQLLKVLSRKKSSFTHDEQKLIKFLHIYFRCDILSFLNFKVLRNYIILHYLIYKYL
tara:strand:+ start:508 stop:1488 length:981 start_codon:yes stop_codon:yes gene_type:complete